jgi:peptidoglycan/xylan/chitin deacetylase (PgdA/CDA1 family)
MRTSLSGVLFVACILLGNTAVGGPATRPTAYIAPFAGNRPAAISYTFDDNLRDQYTIAVPMLDEVGFKGTFFVIAGKTADTPQEGEQKKEDGNVRNLWGGISWPELKKMSEEGHEIASHTWTHPSLTRLPPDELDAQFSKAYDAIKTHIGKPPLTVAFPGNGSNAEVQAAALKYHVAYRAFQQSTSGKSTAKSLNDWADKLVEENKWGVLMTHGIAQGYAALTDPEILRNHFKYVKSRERDIWVDTFANISRYNQERDHATLDVKQGAAGAECTLTCALDPKVYDQPLTIVIPTAGAQSATAERNGSPVPAITKGDVILIDAAPGGGVIKVSWSSRSAQK